ALPIYDQVWYYDYAKIGHFGNKNESTVFEFGKDGVLKRMSKGGAPPKTGNPFLGGGSRSGLLRAVSDSMQTWCPRGTPIRLRTTGNVQTGSLQLDPFCCF